MAILRINKTTNYTVMSNYHLRDSNLTLKAKGLLSYMLSCEDDWQFSIKGLVTIHRENETAIKSALKELQDNGYLIVNKHYPNEECGRIEYEYIIYETPNSEIQGVENLWVENQTLRSTNKRNTKTNTKVLVENSETKPKKLNLYDKCVNAIDEYIGDNNLRDSLVRYLEFRLSVKDKPLYVSQWKALLRKLLTMDNSIDNLIKIVNQSLENGWLSFYELKDNKTYNRKTTQDKLGEYGKVKARKTKDRGDSSGTEF